MNRTGRYRPAVAAFLAALAPVLVLALGAIRLPTLRRRIQTHTAMLKDIPADLAHPLRQVLADEIKTYSNLEQKRLATQATVWAGRRRLARRVGGAFVVVAGVLAFVGTFWYSGQPPRAFSDATWVVLAVAYGATAFSVFARLMAERGRAAEHSHVERLG